MQHRITKTGKNFGSFVIEDFSGKTDFILWSEDYVKFQNYLEKGQNILITGFFRNRFKQENVFEFKATSMSLLETVKQTMTKNVELNLHPAAIDPSFVNFIDENVKRNPGKAMLRFNIIEPLENIRVSLYTYEKGFTMNDEMAEFLWNNPDIDVNVGISN